MRIVFSLIIAVSFMKANTLKHTSKVTISVLLIPLTVASTPKRMINSLECKAYLTNL